MADTGDFVSHDLGETERYLAAAYTTLTISSEDARPLSTVRRRRLGTTTVDRLAFGCDISFDVEPLRKLCLCRLDGGHLETRHADGRTVHQAGDVFVLAPPELPYAGRLRNAVYTAVSMDVTNLDRVAVPADGSESDSVRLTAYEPASSHRSQLSSFLDHLAEVAAVVDRAPTDLVAAGAQDYLSRLILSAFPSNAATGATARDRRDVHSVHLRRAIRVIEDHAHTDLSIADIGRHINVSPRTVQLLFRRHLDCTPMQYLRRVRLNHAHHALVAADPATTTVADIAVGWGFAHPGRFATLYRNSYGRSPSETLQRRA
jgi:AraC-like DNA-binding protein